MNRRHFSSYGTAFAAFVVVLVLDKILIHEDEHEDEYEKKSDSIPSTRPALFLILGIPHFNFDTVEHATGRIPEI